MKEKPAVKLKKKNYAKSTMSLILSGYVMLTVLISLFVLTATALNPDGSKKYTTLFINADEGIIMRTFTPTTTPKPTNPPQVSPTPIFPTIELPPTTVPRPSSDGQCLVNGTDTVIVLDHSLSTGPGTGQMKLDKAKMSLHAFLDELAKNPQNRVGLVAFSTGSTLESPLTNDLNQVKSAVSNVKPEGNETCIECGLRTANDEISSRKRAGINQNVIVITEGRADWMRTCTASQPNDSAVQAAKNEGQKGCADSSITYHTFGIGDVDKPMLQALADGSYGTAQFAPNDNDMVQRLTALAGQLCK